MAAARQLSDGETEEARALEDEIRELQTLKNEIVECARPFSEELAKIARQERRCLDKLHRLRAEKQGTAQQQKADEGLTVLESDSPAPERSVSAGSSSATESEMNNLTLENVQLKQKVVELESIVTVSQRQLKETRRSLSDVQERLTVAEQVTAATQQRALQESDNSEQLQVELTPRQPTASIGLTIKSSSHYACMNVYLFGN